MISQVAKRWWWPDQVSRASYVVTHTHKKKDRKRRRRKIVLRPREIIDLARSPLSCAQREGVCRYHNILIESRSLLCPAQNIIKLLLLKNGPRKKKYNQKKKWTFCCLLFVFSRWEEKVQCRPSITLTASAVCSRGMRVHNKTRRRKTLDTDAARTWTASRQGKTDGGGGGG